VTYNTFSFLFTVSVSFLMVFNIHLHSFDRFSHHQKYVFRIFTYLSSTLAIYIPLVEFLFNQFWILLYRLWARAVTSWVSTIIELNSFYPQPQPRNQTFCLICIVTVCLSASPAELYAWHPI
jgi:predicted membrane channel-forming protein YqfA (hemolysin III family)